MNREIKFRAWWKTEKRWYDFESGLMEYNELTNGQHIAYSDLVSEVHLMQYTGLKDKNGVEIFEGDILKYCNGDLSHIEWIPQDARYQIASIPYLGTYDFEPSETETMYEVIGNIYENPELLQ